MHTPLAQSPLGMTSLLSYRYVDEYNKSSEAENEFMVLKKVSRPVGKNKTAWGGDGMRERWGNGGAFPEM